MFLTCPRCSKSFDSSEPLEAGEKQFSCPHCHSLLKVVTAVHVKEVSEAQRHRASSPERTILVAVEGTATKEMIQEVLKDSGYEVVPASSGSEVLRALQETRPAVALLDVGLPEIMGFELCERIKKSERFRETKVILVASIYDKTRYKREPESLYGADDYIERHHIQDLLIPKIETLLQSHPAVPREVPASREAPAPREVPASRPASAAPEPLSAVQGMDDMLLEEATIYEPVRPARLPAGQAGPAGGPAVSPEPRPSVSSPPVQESKKPQMTGDPEKHEAAKRLARLILSDIALYNQRAVEEGIRNNTFQQVLKDELEEGRKLYRSRVSSDITSATDYYGQAIEEFIRKRKGSK